MDAYEVVGWAGAALVLGAYWLVTRAGTSVRYHVLNLVGSAGLLANAVHHRAFPSTTVNVVWAVIAVHTFAVGRWLRRTSDLSVALTSPRVAFVASAGSIYRVKLPK